jgi:putative FmdB family regulatory protein
MPIYAFQCAECGHDFDRLQKMSDPDPDACPSCGAAAVKRQLTAPSFRLSGSGWYETDFKKDGDKKRNLTESGDGGGKSDSKTDAGDAKSAPAAGKDAAPAAKPEAKSDAKPAAKPESKSEAKPAAPSTPAA